MDVRTLSEILGHTKVALTLQLYTHSSMETKQKELAKMDAFLLFSQVFRYQLRYELRYVAKGVPHFAGFTGRNLRILRHTTKKDLHFCKSCVEHSGFEPLTPTLPVLCATSCANAPSTFGSISRFGGQVNRENEKIQENLQKSFGGLCQFIQPLQARLAGCGIRLKLRQRGADLHLGNTALLRIVK